MALNYQKAGVDIHAGDALVSWIQNSQTQIEKEKFKKTQIGGVGGFAAISRFQFPQFKKPCIVTSTDGVGTKVKLASLAGDYSTVGQDLVAMCVNDLICTGATPWLFLDYYATGKLNVDHAKEFLVGVKRACEDSQCLLVGGETAEMPGVYQENDFDCAGFAVGVVDEDQILGPHRVKPGTVVVGVDSSGFHSNGFSLVRKLFEDDFSSWKDQLLKPTHLYVKLARALTENNFVQALANVTGSGMENLPRVMPEGTCLKLQRWEFPPLFREAQRRSEMSNVEMLTTLNCGIGFALFLDENKLDQVLEVVRAHGFQAHILGRVDAAPDSRGEPTIDYTLWQGAD